MLIYSGVVEQMIQHVHSEPLGVGRLNLWAAEYLISFFLVVRNIFGTVTRLLVFRFNVQPPRLIEECRPPRLPARGRWTETGLLSSLVRRRRALIWRTCRRFMLSCTWLKFITTTSRALQLDVSVRVLPLHISPLATTTNQEIKLEYSLTIRRSSVGSSMNSQMVSSASSFRSSIRCRSSVPRSLYPFGNSSSFTWEAEGLFEKTLIKLSDEVI